MRTASFAGAVVAGTYSTIDRRDSCDGSHNGYIKPHAFSGSWYGVTNAKRKSHGEKEGSGCFSKLVFCAHCASWNSLPRELKRGISGTREP